MKKEYTVIPTKAHRNFAKHKMIGISQNAIDDIPSSKTSLDNIVAYSKQVNTEYRMPTTLGKPKGNKTVMALDSCCERNINVFREEWTRASFPAFIGYSSLALLQQEPLIRAGVETLVDDMTRKFVKIVGTGEEDLTKDIAEIESDFKKFDIKDIFNKANSLCGYQGGCLVYIDVGPVDDETSPLVIDPMTFQKDMLRGFKVIEPINVYPGKYNTTDPTSSDYYVPETWFILGKEYHKSRFLYFSQNELPMLLKPIYNFFGMSLSQQVLDYVHAFTKNREAMQRLLNKFSLTVFRTDMSRLLNGDPTCAADIKRRSEFFAKQRDNDGIALIDNTSEAMEQLNTPLAGVSDIVASSLDMLPIIFGESKDKYYGDLPKGLNASSEGTNRIYYDKILSLNEKINSKNIQKVIEILQVNRGKEVNPDISFNYIPLWEMDEKERAELNKMQADTDAIYLDRGVLAPNEVRDRLAHDANNDYNSIDPDDVPENEFDGIDGDNPDNTDIDNVDKAGAVFDEWDEDKHPRANNGQFGNGSGEYSFKIISIKGNKLGEYNSKEELREKAKEYYEKHLANTEVEHPKLGKILFTKNGFKKPISFSGDERKLKLFPYLPDIIQNGELANTEKDKRNRNNFENIHTIKSDISLDGKRESVRIIIREDNNGNLYYDHTINKEDFVSSGYKSGSRKSPLVEDSVPQEDYVVNLFFEEET